MAGQIFIIPLAADHGGVVAAELQLGEIEPVPAPGAGGGEVGPDAAVGGHAAGHRHPAVALLPGGLHGPGDQRVAHRLAKAGGEGGQVQLLPLLGGVVDQVQGRRLEAGEGQVQGRVGHVGPGQLIPGGVAPLGQTVHGPAAGIADAQHPGHLVEALPRRVVPGGAQDLHVGVALHVHDGAGPPGDTQADEGGLQVGVGDVVGGDVPPDVVDGDQGHPQGAGRRLGEVHPHQHRPDEAGGVGDGDGVQVLPAQPGVGQGPLGQGDDGLHVLPGGDLGDHPAVEGVHLDLGGDAAGQHRPAVLHHRRRRLVAGGLDG